MLVEQFLIHSKKAAQKLTTSLSQLCTTLNKELNSNGQLAQSLQEIQKAFRSLSFYMVLKDLENQRSSTSYKCYSKDTIQLSKQKHWRQTQMHFQQKCLNQIRSLQYSTMETLARLRITRRSIQSSRMRK